MGIKYVNKKVVPFCIEVFGVVEDDSVLKDYFLSMYRKRGYVYVRDSFRIIKNNVRNTQRVLLIGRFIYVGPKGVANFPFSGINVSSSSTMIPVTS